MKFIPRLTMHNIIARKQRAEFAAYLRLLRYPELIWMLHRAVNASGSTGCTVWELERLHRSLISERPSDALELGSGISTLVLAHAARTLERRGTPCRFVSMEESQEYFEDLCRWFPHELWPYVEVRVSPTLDEVYDGDAVGRSYRDTPLQSFSWVFVDGPQLTKKDKQLYFDADAARVSQGQAMVIHVDGRSSTINHLKRILAPDEVWAAPTHNWTTMRIAAAPTPR